MVLLHGVIRIDIQAEGKVRPITGNEGPEVQYMYSSTLALTTALDGVGGERHATTRPNRFTEGEKRSSR